MRSSVFRLVVYSMICTNYGFASVSDLTFSDTAIKDATSQIQTYISNLGAYLGYDLKVSPTSGSSTPSQTLLTVTTSAIQNILIPGFPIWFGAITVNTAGQTLAASPSASNTFFVPSNISGYSLFNETGNATFTYSSFTSPSTTNISVSNLIDQPGSGSNGSNYQSDPVSQNIANILGTPDITYCMDNTESTFVSQCAYGSSLINKDQLMQGILGPAPDPLTFFTSTFNEPVIPQLNVNSLLGPLLYTTTAINNPTSNVVPSSGIYTNPAGGGPLTASSQAQQAQNFVRYATLAVTPPALPSYATYNNMFSQLLTSNTSATPVQQSNILSKIAYYFLQLRSYAAHAGTGAAMLYDVLSKRMPQTVTNPSNSSQSVTTSEALNEYIMSTWRLFDPQSSTATTGSPWVQGLNQASAATSQKEATLILAEINYQLYLTRQLLEKLVVMNSLLLIQGANSNLLPNAELKSSPSNVGTANPGATNTTPTPGGS